MQTSGGKTVVVVVVVVVVIVERERERKIEKNKGPARFFDLVSSYLVC